MTGWVAPRACRDATASLLLSIYVDMCSVAFLNHRLTPASIASWNAKAHAAYTSSFQAVVDRGGFVWNLMRDADNNMALTGGVVPQPINATCKSWMLSKCGNSSWDGASWSVTPTCSTVPYCRLACTSMRGGERPVRLVPLTLAVQWCRAARVHACMHSGIDRWGHGRIDLEFCFVRVHCRIASYEYTAVLLRTSTLPYCFVGCAP